MEERFHNSPAEVSRMNTEELRKAFAITDLMQAGKIQRCLFSLRSYGNWRCSTIKRRNCAAEL